MDWVYKIFKQKKALLKGHFLLSSGLHSDRYIQCAVVLQYPEIAEKLANLLVKKSNISRSDFVISPALGGIIIGQEIAKFLKCRAIFAERDSNNNMVLRRGFKIKNKEKGVIVEDVITTGNTTNELINIVKNSNAKIISILALVDRTEKFDFPVISLLKINIKNYQPEDCPLCRQKIQLVKLGSKKWR